MRLTIPYGQEHLEVDVAESARIVSAAPPVALPDAVVAVRAALEEPFGFPPLRRALTPEDHITIVVDENLPRLAELLTPLLEHIVSAGVAAESITLLCPTSSARQTWLDDLPEAFADVHVEVHNAQERTHLSYLATTGTGKRLYLNRTLVDADQVVIFSARRYDPLLGYGGAEGLIYPTLSDAATLTEMNNRLDLAMVGQTTTTAEEATEAAWLMGAPFFVQLIPAAGQEIAGVVAGTAEASIEGQHALDTAWRQQVTQVADLVIASLSGNPAEQTFADLAAAAACAARVVKPGGRIVLLTQATPPPGPVLDLLRRHEEPHEVLKWLRRHQTIELLPALQWATAASQARLYVLGGLPDETVEELFATPLQQAAQVQRLVDAGGSCLLLPEAHRALVEVVDE